MVGGFRTAAEFDRAMKKAVRESGSELGAGYRQALRDRFLCRVFLNGNCNYVLKGGSGMLARIPNARATRDIDFGLLAPMDPDDAIEELSRLASTDLGDFCRFELTKVEERLDENGYSRLLKLRFASFVGAEEKDPVLIDLSLGCRPVGEPIAAEPSNRVTIPGTKTSPYLLYPLEDQLADKLCAIVELQPGGYQSSRMKDLLDILLIAKTQVIDPTLLSLAITTECKRRNIEVPESFCAPSFWAGGFSRFAKTNGVSISFDRACDSASKFFDPILRHEATGKWIPEKQCWSG